ncbi:MAG: fibronectin type III domain-containing protein, partial [Flavobacterium sp.]
PTALTVANPTNNSVNLSWTSPGTSFTVAYGPIGFTPEVSEDGMVSGITATQTTINNLNAATTYQFYVRRDCGANDSSVWVGPVSSITEQIVATLPLTEDFESSPLGWTLSNGSQVNKWVVGTAPHNGGENSIYAKHFRELKFSLNKEMPNFFRPKTTLYLNKQGVFHPIDKLSDLLKLLENKKNEITAYLKGNKLRYDKNPSSVAVEILKFYENTSL